MINANSTKVRLYAVIGASAGVLNASSDSRSNNAPTATPSPAATCCSVDDKVLASARSAGSMSANCSEL